MPDGTMTTNLLLKPNTETSVSLDVSLSDAVPGLFNVVAESDTDGQLGGNILQGSATNNGGLDLVLQLRPGLRVRVKSEDGLSIVYDSQA